MCVLMTLLFHYYMRILYSKLHTVILSLEFIVHIEPEQRRVSIVLYYYFYYSCFVVEFANQGHGFHWFYFE